MEIMSSWKCRMMFPWLWPGQSLLPKLGLTMKFSPRSLPLKKSFNIRLSSLLMERKSDGSYNYFKENIFHFPLTFLISKRVVQQVCKLVFSQHIPPDMMYPGRTIHEGKPACVEDWGLEKFDSKIAVCYFGKSSAPWHFHLLSFNRISFHSRHPWIISLYSLFLTLLFFLFPLNIHKYFVSRGRNHVLYIRKIEFIVSVF